MRFPLINGKTKFGTAMKIRRNLFHIYLPLAVLLQALTAGAQPVIQAAAGGGQSLFLKSDGSLWVMGTNVYGQLGDGTYNRTNLPERIMASNVTAIATGFNHSLFLKKDGSLWAMGQNGYGQLGDGTLNNTNRPEQIVPTNVMAIAAAANYSLFLKSDGSLWGMGANNSSQLGDGTSNDTNRPEQIVPTNVTAIATENYTSLFLKSDGSLWGMGENIYGQLGDGTYNNTNRPEQILAAYNQIASRPLGGGKMQFAFVGIAGTNYALDRSVNLVVSNWIPQATNPANSYGALIFTNTPNATTNNFWRIRSVP